MSPVAAARRREATSVAPAPPARAPRTHAPVARARRARAEPARVPRVPRATRSRSGTGRAATVVVIATVLALVTAVVFHVVLAQHQMELDRINASIVREQRRYEQDQLTVSALAAPQRVIADAERLGLVVSPVPAQYLWVPGAPMPSASDGGTATTFADWTKVKSRLGDQQP